MNFCTLFDSYYLDKGIALYRSLEKVSDDFRLYIFCFDDKSREILAKENMEHATILHHSDIETETDKLLELKKERSKAEYCWTCTPVIIEYVLNHYPVESCTYIDADLYFFADPQILFDEVKTVGAHVVITEHRFSNSLRDKQYLKRSGKYCVEFNYFDKSREAKEALVWWKERCFEWCFHLYEPERMGDQKYLEQFPKRFEGVHELQHLGGGTAPWNLAQYELVSVKEKEAAEVVLREKKSGNVFPLVFYHFQNIRYLSDKKVNVNSGTHTKALKDAIYLPYLKCIEQVRRQLKNVGVDFSVKKSYSSNPVIAFAQKNILQYKIKSISDLYDLEEIRKGL